MTWLFEKLALQSDLVRAIRAATVYSAVLLVCAWAGDPRAIPFAATTSLAMSLPLLRGAYHIRVAVLLVLTLVITVAAFWGAAVAGNTFAVVAGIGVLALLSGLWRQLSTDYGAAFGINSAMVFLLAIEGTKYGSAPSQIAVWCLMGGLGAIVLHIATWLFHPQHALRHVVAEAWVSASDYFLAMRIPSEGSPPPSLSKSRRDLREALDRSISVVNAARGKRNREFMEHMDQMRHELARFSTRVTAFHMGIEALAGTPEFAKHTAAIDSLMVELGNMARSVAITLITHEPEHCVRTATRLQTCKYLIEVLDQQLADLAANPRMDGHARSLLRTVEAELPRIESALVETVDHSQQRRPFAMHLPDLTGRSMRSIAAGLNPAPSFDPRLARYSLRMAVLAMFAVTVYQVLEVPRGYWMVFALIVVLQPDYGATRQRACHRIAGTIAGVLCGSALLLVPLPMWALGTLAIMTVFGFVYYLRRAYRVAVFFVTVMLVLLTEMHMPVHVDFTIERLLSNVAGAALALAAALYFWPRWERREFPTLLAKAIRANRGYLEEVMKQFVAPGGSDREFVRAKQSAERAGNLVAASLERMQGEPAKKQQDIPRAIGAVACNERVIRAVAMLSTHRSPEALPPDAGAFHFADEIGRWMEAAAFLAEHGPPSDEVPEARHPSFAAAASVATDGMQPHVVDIALEKLSTEVLALLEALKAEKL